MRLATGIALIVLGFIFLNLAYFSIWPFVGWKNSEKWREGAMFYRVGLSFTSIAAIVIGSLYLANVF